MPVARTLSLDAAALGYVMPRTSGAISPSLDPRERDPLVWLTAPTVQDGGAAAFGYVSTIGNAARRAGDVGITGASARTIELLFRVPDGAGALIAFGAQGANAGDVFEVIEGGDARWSHGGNDVRIPGAGGGQGWRHLVLRADAQGRCRATVDGVLVVDTVFPNGPLNTARG